jgi:DnaD/phage-associated family protein
MARMPWLRLYTEILDDPKLSSWTGDQFRMLIYFFCLARESDKPGLVLLTPADIAWRTRRPVEEVEEVIRLGCSGPRPILAMRPEGIEVMNWFDRQYDYPSSRPEATRTRKVRERAEKKAKKENFLKDVRQKLGVSRDNLGNTSDSVKNHTVTNKSRPRHELVTPSHEEYTDTDIDKETDRDKSNVIFSVIDIQKSGADPEKGGVGGKEKTPRRAADFNSESEKQKTTPDPEPDFSQYPDELVQEAKRRAAVRGKPRANYVEAILRRWNESGFTTLAAVMEADPPPRAGSAPLASLAGTGQARADPTAEQKRLEEGVRCALTYMRLTIGESPGREQVEEWLTQNDYGPDVTAAVKEKLFGGDG